jgi:peptidoglycan/xylan/chitin deacetylase (PgdA/CDA1 family)
MAADSYKIPVADFQAHLQALADIPLDARGAALDPAGSTPATPVLLTFDDGGSSALTTIAPLLEAAGWRGHFFVTTGRLGQSGFLTEAGVRDLASRGHWIGSHSESHPLRMAALPEAELRREWSHSIERLSAILGSRVTLASVPGGGFSRRVAAAAGAAGIRVLFTSEPEVGVREHAGVRIIGRFTLRRGDGSRRAARFARGVTLARWTEWTWWNGKKLAKAIGGPAYLGLRRALMGE